MLFWYGFTLYIYFLTFFTYDNKKWRFLPWLFLFIVSAFRYNVGTDYAHYYHLYVYKDGMFWYKELGYTQLVSILSDLGFNPQMMFFTFSLFTIILFYKSFIYFFKNDDTKFLFATLLFIPLFYFYSLNGIRQALAIAIFFYSLRYVINKSFFKYFILIIIATLFHRSAFILIPIYFILQLDLTKYKLFMFYIFLILFFLINPIKYIEEIFVSNQLPLYYYFNDENAMQGVSGFGKVVAISSVLLILSLSYILDREKPIEKLIFNSMLIFAFIKILALEISFLDRFSLYFKPLMVLFIIYIGNKVIKKVKYSKNIILVSLILLSFSYTSLVVYIRGNHDESYNQYALNLYLYGKEDGILQIYRDANRVKY